MSTMGRLRQREVRVQRHSQGEPAEKPTVRMTRPSPALGHPGECSGFSHGHEIAPEVQAVCRTNVG